MIILDTDTKSLEVLLGAAVALNQLDIVAAYVDIGSANQMVNAVAANDLLTNDAVPVEAVPAPNATESRQVKSLTIYNNDSQVNTVTVQYDNNGTIRIIIVKALAPGETLQYTDGIGWEVLEVPTVESSFVGQNLFTGRENNNGPTTIFTATAPTKITQIHISNISGSNTTFSLWIDANGAAGTNSDNLIDEAPINKDSFVLLSEVGYYLEIGGEIAIGQGIPNQMVWTIDGEVLT